ncbi:MAG TPA: glycosyltransferase family 4 protein [Isosphaeraceae bacterium]|jgi:glycosyltransferase involved in cell wall biosynthesis|nr:glycosyltransferase family 4 protein [Isosphaeraceae bacterium]
MRIAWFSHRYYPCVGGAENYGRAMVRRFVAEGGGVDVLTSDAHDLWYFNDPRRRRVEEPAESRVDGARVRRFRVRHYRGQRYVGRALSYLPHWPTRCRFESYMPILPGLGRVRGDYDAVFAVGFPYTVFSFAAWRTARAAGAPLILTPFLHLATPGDAVNRHYTKPHQIRLLAEADAVVVQTNLEADSVAAWGIPRGRIVRLGMGVEHDEVTGGDRAKLRDRLGIPDSRTVVGHLATLDPNKGTNDLVHAVARLNERRGADPIQLLLAGPSSPDFEAFARAMPDSSRAWLSMIGPLPTHDRADFFAALDLFAMPSRTDSFGIVFLEAWANGLAVVAAAAGGVAEVVADGRTGWLVPFGDLDRLADAIGALVADPGRARRLGEAGRALVASGYTWDDRFRVLDDRTRMLIASRRVGLGPRPTALALARPGRRGVS